MYIYMLSFSVMFSSDKEMITMQNTKHETLLKTEKEMKLVGGKNKGIKFRILPNKQ